MSIVGRIGPRLLFTTGRTAGARGVCKAEQTMTRACVTLRFAIMTTINLEGDSLEQRVERMKSEFLAAQQRHRDTTRHVPGRPDGTNDEPRTTDDLPDLACAVASAVRKLEPLE